MSGRGPAAIVLGGVTKPARAHAMIAATTRNRVVTKRPWAIRRWRRSGRVCTGCSADFAAPTSMDVTAVCLVVARARSPPAAGFAQQPVQDATGDLAAVIGGGAYVIDRLQLARQHRHRVVCDG